MTKQEAKHLSDVLKAYSEGKNIQSSYKNSCEPWITVHSNHEFDFSLYEYRVTPEPKYRPYKNAEEFLKAQKEHGLYIYIREGYYDNPVRVLNEGVAIIDFDLNKKHYNECEFISYFMLLRDFKFVDGTPCGVIEE